MIFLTIWNMQYYSGQKITSINLMHHWIHDSRWKVWALFLAGKILMSVAAVWRESFIEKIRTKIKVLVWNFSVTEHLRICDINSVSSKVKSWLLQDLLEKPAEMVLHRPIQMGGLGVHSVRYKALASLIRTFMETAAHPGFKHSLYHTTLYRVYVLDDTYLWPWIILFSQFRGFM